jgi:hypothetical protein
LTTLKFFRDENKENFAEKVNVCSWITQDKNKQEKSELNILKEKYNLLKEENKKLLNINATLLFKSRSK